jgi:SAM-dependent methyltransferase
VTRWDSEYERAGIPSSYRVGPSGVVEWLLSNWPDFAGTERPGTALDVGCGTGRNTLHLASLGAQAIGIDASAAAIAQADEKVAASAIDLAVRFEQRALQDGLPAEDDWAEVLLDIYVYKHQLDPGERAAYRADMARVLAPGGLVLMSLAHVDDGYYGQCPRVPGHAGVVVSDPQADGIESVLFTLPELVAEMSDRFELVASWLKTKVGDMHGAGYERRTLATVWRVAS